MGRIFFVKITCQNTFGQRLLTQLALFQIESYLEKILSKIPNQFWKGRKPNISYFRDFECKCFVLNNNKDHLEKFDAKSNEGLQNF